MNAALPRSRDELPTPALCIDLDALDANIAAVAALCRQHRVAWRPHAKCHKSPPLAKRLLAAGAIGLTCAKVSEAAVFAAEGIRDLLIANLIAGADKVNRLVELRRQADPIICLDHLDQAVAISQAMQAAGLRVRALLEVDIGLGRAGVLPGRPALELARKVADLKGLELAGVMGYEGHLLQIADPVEKAEKIAEALGQLVETAELLRKDGFACPIVSCGGSGSLPCAVRQKGITEVQAGGVVFMDAFYRYRCHLEGYQNALFVLATVVSRPASDRAIMDAGRKTMHGDFHPPLVVGRPGITVERMSAEHGILKLAPPAQDLRIGERLELIPGYSDFTTVLHDRFWVCQGDRVVDVWPLAARGCLA
jgi:D-serine deaminase-like pyridoxal phosphate-dependent protein